MTRKRVSRSRLNAVALALSLARMELACVERRAGAYAAQAALAQAQLNSIPAWVLYLVAGWRDMHTKR